MRMIIDADPAMGSLGGDPEDGFAIMLALNTPGVTVEGITIVQGNVPAEKGYANTKRLLELLGREEQGARAPGRGSGCGLNQIRSSRGLPEPNVRAVSVARDLDCPATRRRIAGALPLG